MGVQFLDRGICVNDLAQATSFYHHALDFEPVAAVQAFAGSAADALTGTSNVQFSARTVRNAQGVSLKLVQFDRPGGVGPRVRRPNNQYGLTHLAFYVDDIDASAARIGEAGGAVHHHSRAIYRKNMAELMYCTDPDGTRIELMYAPKEAPRFSHSGICLTDIASSLQFYCDVLGFSVAENHVLDDQSCWLDIINELKDVKLRAQMIRDPDGNTLELLHISSPACVGAVEPSPINQYGLMHLAFLTDDIGTLAQAIGSAGGQAHWHTRGRLNGMEQMLCTSPDGIRIALFQSDGASQPLLTQPRQAVRPTIGDIQ